MIAFSRVLPSLSAAWSEKCRVSHSEESLYSCHYRQRQSNRCGGTRLSRGGKYCLDLVVVDERNLRRQHHPGFDAGGRKLR